MLIKCSYKVCHLLISKTAIWEGTSRMHHGTSMLVVVNTSDNVHNLYASETHTRTHTMLKSSPANLRSLWQHWKINYDQPESCQWFAPSPPHAPETEDPAHTINSNLYRGTPETEDPADTVDSNLYRGTPETEDPADTLNTNLYRWTPETEDPADTIRLYRGTPETEDLADTVNSNLYRGTPETGEDPADTINSNLCKGTQTYVQGNTRDWRPCRHNQHKTYAGKHKLMQGNNKDWNSAGTISPNPTNSVNSNLCTEIGWHYHKLYFLSQTFGLNEQQNQEKNTNKNPVQ